MNGEELETRGVEMHRRSFVSALLLGSAAGAVGLGPASAFEIAYSDAEWRKRLSPQAYQVLRHQVTEPAFSSPLNDEHRKGTFLCGGCALPLYASTTKFESGTGWPSFWRPLPKAVLTKPDNSYGMQRTEVLCRRCGGHLGHVFNDGPPPTGLRYCMNGLAMTFKAA
jgi:peptide-methionine (R)-S-oxide reductase